jgi:hypothetical protein
MANNQGECPIYMRITIAGERYEVGTKRFVLEESWSKDTGGVKGVGSKAKSKFAFWDLFSTYLASSSR